LYDDRRYKSDEDIDVGYNGFITMVFDGPTLEVHYYDLYNTLLLTERWISNGRGNLEGPQLRNVNSALTQNDPGYIKSHS
jgi:hypothetical protein